jgi:hypothetical protein
VRIKEHNARRTRKLRRNRVIGRFESLSPAEVLW